MTKAILFDFWGTLVNTGVWSPVKQVKNTLKISLPFSEYIGRMERAMMTQKFPSLKKAFENICMEFNISCAQALIEELIGMWNKSWLLAKPYEETEEVLKELQSKYMLILVSNTDCFGVKNVMEKFGFDKFFDKAFFSYELGLLKTDKNFLKHVLGEINLNAEDCILVGDSIQSDIMPAKRVGMKAILVDRRDSRNFTPKIKSLNELEEVLSKCLK